jgi:hypothetical protein
MEPDPQRETGRYIVEIPTRSGKICEVFPSYARAIRRINKVPDAELTGMPLIFKELTDGSQRIIREDEKPLQWHRLPEQEDNPEADSPLPLAECEGPSPLSGMKIIEKSPGTDWPEE